MPTLAAAAANPEEAKTALSIAWIGAGGTVLAAFIAGVVAIVQVVVKKSADPVSLIDRWEEEHDKRLEAEKKVADLQAQLATQIEMNNALIRRLDNDQEG